MYLAGQIASLPRDPVGLTCASLPLGGEMRYLLILSNIGSSAASLWDPAMMSKK